MMLTWSPATNPCGTDVVTVAVPPDQDASTIENESFRKSSMKVGLSVGVGTASVYGDQNSAVTIAPASGVSQNAVAYGVMINTYQPEDANVSLDQATHDLLASLRQSNPDLREIGHDESIRVNGVAGKSVNLIGSSPVQENGRSARERDWLVTLNRRDGSLLYLVFIAPDSEFSSLRPTFEQMLNSLRLR